jgi:Fur family transcriptional regulator, ferric uptake regulator
MPVGDVDLGSVHEAAAARLHQGDQLYTKGRRELVELLATIGRPATVPDLLAAQPRLTQSSVYRNLAVLEELGIVDKVTSSDDRARYELAETLIGHHHHMICVSCGRVDDFVVSAPMEHQLGSVLADAVGESGFRPSGHRLDVIGVCEGCP